MTTKSGFKLVAISGNTHRPSKSHALAGHIAGSVASRTGIAFEHYDLIDAGGGLGAAYFRSQLSVEAEAVVEAIETADALIFATPVYKGSYPGLFKHLIDFIDPEALVHKPVQLAASGGGHRHALIIEHQLRPLFGFFSAQVASTSIYASDAEFADGAPAHPQLLERIDLAVGQFARLIDNDTRSDADNVPFGQERRPAARALPAEAETVLRFGSAAQ